MAKGRPRYASAHEIALFAVSIALVAVIGLAVAGGFTPLYVAIVISGAAATLFLRRMFPDAPFFALTFANLIGLYAAIFSFFMQGLFGLIGSIVSGIGFSLPIAFFLVGCWWRRQEVLAVVEHPDIRTGGRLYKAMQWLVPVFLVGAGAFVLSSIDAPLVNNDIAFLVAMVLIGLIVLGVSRNVAVFLVDAGLLFEEFFHRMSRLAIPAFAFLTFYSLLVIVFAALYSILSQYSGGVHFRVADVARTITFSEAIHLSIATISTVGYGDIVPVSDFARVLTSIEVICGVLLLLFGVSELLEYMREHRREHPGHDKTKL